MNPDVDFFCMATLGRLLINWGFAEHTLEDLIAGIMGADISHVNALTANIATEYQIKSARTLARLRLDEAAFAQFDSALEQFEELIPFRNKLVHGFWAEHEHEDIWTVSSIKSTGHLKYQTEFVNAEYLAWLEGEVRRVMTLFFAFGEQHGLLYWSSKEALPDTLATLTALSDRNRP
jgi:hypothetical protein